MTLLRSESFAGPARLRQGASASDLAKRDAKILKLYDAKKTRPAIAEKVGCSLHIVDNVIKKARAIRAAEGTGAQASIPAQEGAQASEGANGEQTRALSDILIGQRHRKDFGDLAALARSIDANGLLQPIAITPENVLIAGERRMRAWPLTKFSHLPIPVHVVDLASILSGEWAENGERKDFTPSEIVAIKRALEPRLKEEAASRRGMRTDLLNMGGISPDVEARRDPSPSPSPQGGGEARDAVPGAAAHGSGATSARASREAGENGEKKLGRAADQLGAYVGKDRKTLAKMEAVVSAAEQEPEKFGGLLDDMDRTGRVDGPFRRLQVMQQTEAIRKAPAPAPMNGPYRGIVIDYPWPHEPDASQEEIDRAGRSLRPYPAMALEAGEIFMREQVRPLIGEHAVVAFWTTNFHMRHAFRLLDALGVGREGTILTWVKDRIGRGQILRDKTEHVIFWMVGSPVIHLTNQTTELRAPRRKNSQKPDEFYRMFEQLVPAERYADIFSRGGRGDLWDCHGDQVGMFDPSAVAQSAKADAEGDSQIDLEELIEGEGSPTNRLKRRELVDAYAKGEIDLPTLRSKVAGESGKLPIELLSPLARSAERYEASYERLQRLADLYEKLCEGLIRPVYMSGKGKKAQAAYDEALADAGRLRGRLVPVGASIRQKRAVLVAGALLAAGLSDGMRVRYTEGVIDTRTGFDSDEPVEGPIHHAAGQAAATISSGGGVLFLTPDDIRLRVERIDRELSVGGDSGGETVGASPHQDCSTATEVPVAASAEADGIPDFMKRDQVAA